MAAVQLYIPEWSSTNELIKASLLACVDPRATGTVEFSDSPDGPLKEIVTLIGMSTAELTSTEEVRVTADPIGRMGFGLLLVTITWVGAGTKAI